MNITGLKDVKVRRSGMGYDLDISPHGRIQYVMGADKLITQCIRAVMNSEIFSSLINFPVGELRADGIERSLSSLKFSQVLQTYTEKINVKGFIIYKSIDGLNFSQLTRIPISRDFIDRSENEVEVFYDIHPYYDTGEGTTVASFRARATSSPRRRRIFIFDTVVAIEGDNMIIFKFLLPRKFLADEILDSVEFVDVREGKDPRSLSIQIGIRSYGKTLPTISLEVQQWS